MDKSSCLVMVLWHTFFVRHVLCKHVSFVKKAGNFEHKSCACNLKELCFFSAHLWKCQGYSGAGLRTQIPTIIQCNTMFALNFYSEAMPTLYLQTLKSWNLRVDIFAFTFHSLYSTTEHVKLQRWCEDKLDAYFGQQHNEPFWAKHIHSA